MDITRSNEELSKLIPVYDCVVSLLPYMLHPEIAKLCIMHKTNMVNASYVSPAMRELHQGAKAAGITIMNEVGVDPGVDHLLAQKCFDEVIKDGGKVTSYVSWCGGLPAPEFSNSPLHYKFSWFPRGVLMDCMGIAKFKQDGKVVEVPGGGGLLFATVPLDFMPGFNLEGFPNRDSTVYGPIYGIESAHTILRGTLRYRGFINAVRGLIAVGLFDESPDSLLHPKGPDLTWRSYMSQKFGESADILPKKLESIVFDKVGEDEYKLRTIVDLGLLGEDLVDKRGNPFDTLSNYLAKRLAYGPHERDLIVMRHEIGIMWPDSTQEERQLDFTCYGDIDGCSAMAKTVGFPTAIATKMILDGEIQEKGVVIPLNINVYNPMLNRLKQEGISAREKIIVKY